MNILYIGAFPPAFLVKRNDGKIDSLYRASEAIVSGLRCQEGADVKVITSPDVASWPKGPFYIRCEYSESEDLTLVSSLNISILKQIWTIVSMAKEASRVIRKSDGPVVVIIPYIVFRHVFTLRLLKRMYPKKVVQACIVPDIFFPKNWLLKKVNQLTEKMASHFDAFLLYTEKMAEHLHITGGHYEVLEGYREVSDRQPECSDDFRVVYAGSLNLNYGIGRLIDAMGLINDPEVQLHLYGAGTGENYIKAACKNDKRIYFYGRVPNADAFDAIYKATVLINPRNANDGKYTEYSFPSKNIEYMATGIPTLLCRLPGMPKEYWGHFIDMGDGEPKQIAEAIQRTKAMNQSVRDEIGQKAREFIVERMDCRKQGQRIIELFHRIINTKQS